jgi:hypothetical protein
MSVRGIVAAAVIAALLVAIVPLPARAGDRPAPAPATHIRLSVDDAVAAELASQPRVQTSSPTPKTRVAAKVGAGQSGGGGGGGGGMMVMMLVGLAASAAGTYFLVKELRKKTNQTQTGQ